MSDRCLVPTEANQVLSAVERSQCVLRLDMNGHILAVSDSYLSISGYHRDEILGQSLQVLCDPSEDRTAVAGILTGLKRGNEMTGTHRHIHRDGSPLWVVGCMFPVRNAQGEVSSGVFVGQDVTSSRLAAADASSRLRAMNRSQAVIEFKPGGEIIWANENFLSTMGYTLEEIVGRHHRLFCQAELAESHEYRQFWDDLSSGGFRQVEDRRIRKDGGTVWISGTYNALTDDTGRVIGVIKYATDITRRRKAVEELVEALNNMSAGDLTRGMASQLDGDFSAVRDTFNGMLSSMTMMVAKIRDHAENMNREAGEIADGANDLARRGESQAAELEQTSAAVEQISVNIATTSQSARDADSAARNAQAVVLGGVDVVAQAISAIERIDEHTKQMGEFTRVIEGFAFQTNLLSINAAVEAARAGDVGRGFAVVANEVRNLAQQSANASQNIAELIAKSEAEVKAGVKLVRDAGVSLEHIQSAVGGVVENIAGIAHATTEQSAGVREVSQSLAQLDGVNQANLSTSERYATAAAELSAQVEKLGAMMDRFTINEATAPLVKPTQRVA
ncbi:MAG: hypothetical protein DI498_06265 [Paracoccus denitrificans]|nr:MAG: hypothetical protein DI498_06265 [Paracoccus denitrificans]PZO84701.1 MAG: hypothetical protein DI633_06265 [Paracoccus denitrificans]